MSVIKKYTSNAIDIILIHNIFNWNFFDTLLQQKEGYSDYVFEDTAAQLLKDNTNLKSEFEDLKAKDPAFNKNPEAQLDWIYKHSDYYEKAHLNYPVYRIL